MLIMMAPEGEDETKPVEKVEEKKPGRFDVPEGWENLPPGSWSGPCFPFDDLVKKDK